MFGADFIFDISDVLQYPLAAQSTAQNQKHTICGKYELSWFDS